MQKYQQQKVVRVKLRDAVGCAGGRVRSDIIYNDKWERSKQQS